VETLRLVLADNQAVLVARLEDEVKAFETRYGIPSGDLAAAIRDGRLEDTMEICDWAIAWEELRAASGGQAEPARLG
jgi:hypothetical protein